MTAMAYTSGYLAVFGVVMIGVSLLARVPSWLPRAGAVSARFGLAAALTLVATLPLFLHYRRAAIEEGLVRSLSDVSMYSVQPRAYLASAGRVHFYTWSGEFFRTSIDYFFPGFVALLLAAVAVAYVARHTTASDDMALARQRVLMLVAIAFAGFVLSLGTNTPIYGWLYAVFPPMQGLRAASRFGNLFLLGIAALAGLGLSLLRQRRQAFRASIVGVALVIAVNAESFRAPFYYSRFAGIPDIYAELADHPGPVVLVEIPFYPPRTVFENATYVLNSTAHWRPIMNGYSGHTPALYRKYADAFGQFPSPGAILAMKQAGATHVMVHPARLWVDRAAAGTFHGAARDESRPRADCHRAAGCDALSTEVGEIDNGGDGGHGTSFNSEERRNGGRGGHAQDSGSEPMPARPLAGPSDGAIPRGHKPRLIVRAACVLGVSLHRPPRITRRHRRHLTWVRCLFRSPLFLRFSELKLVPFPPSPPSSPVNPSPQTHPSTPPLTSATSSHVTRGAGRMIP